MKKIALEKIDRMYKNNGQHAEQIVRFTLLGEICKADNKPAHECGDVLNYQVKSARATVCKGLDLDKYLEMDAATEYIYVMADFESAVIMSKAEYKAFCETFAKPAYESQKNGGAVKLRLPQETKAMREYLSR